MKSLVVFYSLEGHTRFIAEIIAREAQADIVELKPQKEKTKTGISKYFWGGKSVLFGEKPALLSPLPDTDAYELIFIGTPVWASSFTPPVNTFLSRGAMTGKKLMLFACHAGGGADKCFNKMKERLRSNQVVGTIDFKEPTAENGAAVEARIKDWLSGAHS